MNISEIKINIARLEKTIKANHWNAGYVANCERQLNEYKELLNKV